MTIQSSFSLLFISLFASFSLVLAQEEIPGEVPVVVSSWWQIANENYDAEAYSNKPEKGEPTLRDHQQVSDFTIYKAANGKWQLVSAVRATKFPGTNHFLFRWEADDINDTNWEERGIFYTTHDFPDEAGYAEGVFFAPHCIQDAGTFYMFHNSDGTAHVLTSKDGIDFQLHRNDKASYTLFETGEAGRDLMVLDNRLRDGLWYVYYASYDPTRTELNDRQFTDIYVRTTKNLTGPFSQPTAVGMGTPDRPPSIEHYPANFVNAESPFVIYHDGFYYKFEQGFVVASRDPNNFEGKPVVANIFPHFKYPEDWWPALAPEIVLDGEKMYIAYFMNHHEHPLRSLRQGGVFVAEMGWTSYIKK